MIRTNKNTGILALCLLASSMGMLSQTSSVLADTIQGTEFINSASGPDFKNYDDDKAVPGLFQNLLSLNGLPMVSDFGKTYSGPSGPITQYDPSTGEVQWWKNEVGPLNTPLTSVTVAGITGLGVDIAQDLFPTGSSSDNPYMAADHWQIKFNVTNPNENNLILAIRGDDDALGFVDGQLLTDDGGTHAISVAPAVGKKELTVGEHTLDVFFADRGPVQAGIQFVYVVTPEPINYFGAFVALGLGAFVKKKTNSKIR